MRPAGLFSVGCETEMNGSAVFALQPFEFDVIEEIAGGTIDLVEQKAVEFVGVLLGVGDQLAERLPLVALARRLGDPEEPDDLAAGRRRVAPERILLHREREALAFLFPTADPCQCDEPLHDDSPPRKRVEQTTHTQEHCNGVFGREKAL